MSSDNRTPASAAAAGIFSAANLKRRMAEREAARAAEELRRMQAQEEQQKAVMAEFYKPPERTPEQLLQAIMQLVSRAAEGGQTEIQVYRFPNAMCTDRGPPDQQCRARLAANLGGPPQSRLRILARAPEPAGLWAQGRGARISRRHDRRHRLFSDLEIAAAPGGRSANLSPAPRRRLAGRWPAPAGWR